MRQVIQIMGQFFQNIGESPLKTIDFSKFIFRSAQVCFDAGFCLEASGGGSAGFLNNIVTMAGAAGAFVALVMSALGAYKIIMSGGDPNQVRDGKEQIQNALLGFLLVLLAAVIVVVIFNSLGVT